MWSNWPNARWSWHSPEKASHVFASLTRRALPVPQPPPLIKSRTSRLCEGALVLRNRQRLLAHGALGIRFPAAAPAWAIWQLWQDLLKEKLLGHTLQLREQHGKLLVFAPHQGVWPNLFWDPTTGQSKERSAGADSTARAEEGRKRAAVSRTLLPHPCHRPLPIVMGAVLPCWILS